MEISQITIGIVGGCLYWLFIRFVINHKSALAKSEADRKKLTQRLYFGLFFIITAYFGGQILINSKTTWWISWLILGSYLLLWGVGLYFLRKAYVLGIKKDVASVRKRNGQAIKSPEKFTRAVAVINFLTGLSILAFAVSILILKIKFADWAPIVGVIAALRFSYVNWVERNDET